MLVLSILLYSTHAFLCAQCPNEEAFVNHGWALHKEQNFQRILKEKLCEFHQEIGRDLVLDDSESYISAFSYDYYIIMWIQDWDRISTKKDEMTL